MFARTLLSAQGTKAPDERDNLLSLLLLLAGLKHAFISQGLAHNRPFCVTIHPLIQLIASLHSKVSEITSTSLVLEPQVARYSNTASEVRVNSNFNDTHA